MLAMRASTLLLGCFAFSSLLALLAQGGSTPRQDNAWKRYYNTQWGYCVSYPARWRKGDAFEGSGIFVETGAKKQSNPVGEIDIAALPNRLEKPQLNFVDDLQVHVEGLEKFERAQQMELLEQRPMDFLGHSALFTKERYYDPLERARWIDEIVFTRRQDVLYRLELECRADQLARFEPVFTHFVSSFQFDCAPHR
ncbi:MAG: hypothetical protein JO022_03135 [Acidobacteriaceae bacterium]|nr:hypothetical protein [Acidobacteriaceae bacterium]